MKGGRAGASSLALLSGCAMLTGIMHPGALRLTCRMTTLGSRISPPVRCPRGLQKSFRSDGGFGTFQGVLGYLREHCPAAQPVIIRSAWLADETAGECVRRPKRFVIRLNRNLSEAMAVETLLHEWAHALAWNFALDRLAKAPDTTSEQFQAAAHDEAWGCAYSRVWRAYLGVIREAEG